MCPEEKNMSSRQKTLLEPIVTELGFELVDVEYVKEGRIRGIFGRTLINREALLSMTVKR